MEKSKSTGLSRASQKRKRKSFGAQPSQDSSPITKKSKSTLKSQTANPIDSAVVPASASINIHASYNVDSLRIVDILDEKDCDCIAPEKAAKLFSLILNPTSRQTFYDDYRDKKPIYASKDKNRWLKGFISVKSIESLWTQRILLHNEDIRVTKFVSNSFEDLSQGIQDSQSNSSDMVALNAGDVSDYLSNCYCLTLLQPQRYHDRVWHLLSALEYEFDCMLSCHIYYYPANSQGYDVQVSSGDIFLIQVSGKCACSVYARHTYDSVDISTLPTNPFLHATISPGDMLYIPSGCAYKLINSSNDEASICMNIHTTNNTMQSYFDLILPQAVAVAASKATSKLGQQLPRNFLSYMGVSASEVDPSIDAARQAFQQALKESFREIVNEALDISDAAADQTAKTFISQRLPIPMTAEEEQYISIGYPTANIASYTKLRMLRPGIARAMVEDGVVVVYHCMDNARYLYGAPINPLEFELDDGPAIEGLLNAYPDGIVVEELHHPSEELSDKISIAQALYKEGFLLIVDEASMPPTVNLVDDDDNDPF